MFSASPPTPTSRIPSWSKPDPGPTMTARSLVRILGIDPGLRVTGWGLLETAGDLPGSPAYWGVIKPRTGAPIEQRLLVIQRELDAILARYQPVVVALERPFLRNNVRSALALGQAQAAAMLAAAAHGLPVFEYAPRQVKQAVSGDGNADKSALARALTVQLGLDQIPTPDDASDALAIAACHLLLEGVGDRLTPPLALT